MAYGISPNGTSILSREDSGRPSKDPGACLRLKISEVSGRKRGEGLQISLGHPPLRNGSEGVRP